VVSPLPHGGRGAGRERDGPYRRVRLVQGGARPQISAEHAHLPGRAGAHGDTRRPNPPAAQLKLVRREVSGFPGSDSCRVSVHPVVCEPPRLRGLLLRPSCGPDFRRIDSSRNQTSSFWSPLEFTPVKTGPRRERPAMLQHAERYAAGNCLLTPKYIGIRVAYAGCFPEARDAPFADGGRIPQPPVTSRDGRPRSLGRAGGCVSASRRPATPNPRRGVPAAAPARYWNSSARGLRGVAMDAHPEVFHWAFPAPPASPS